MASIGSDVYVRRCENSCQNSLRVIAKVLRQKWVCTKVQH